MILTYIIRATISLLGVVVLILLSTIALLPFFKIPYSIGGILLVIFAIRINKVLDVCFEFITSKQ